MMQSLPSGKQKKIHQEFEHLFIYACQLPLELANLFYTKDIHMQKHVIMEVYANKWMKNQFCKLFALTDGAVTWDMSVMS